MLFLAKTCFITNVKDQEGNTNGIHLIVLWLWSEEHHQIKENWQFRLHVITCLKSLPYVYSSLMMVNEALSELFFCWYRWHVYFKRVHEWVVTSEWKVEAATSICEHACWESPAVSRRSAGIRSQNLYKRLHSHMPHLKNISGWLKIIIKMNISTFQVQHQHHNSSPSS